MLSNWFAQPEGSAHSSADEGKGAGDADQDTQVMEPDQGNGKPVSNSNPLRPFQSCLEVCCGIQAKGRCLQPSKCVITQLCG